MDADQRTPVVRNRLALAMLVQYGVGGALLPFVTLLMRDRGLPMAQVSLILMASSAALLVSPLLWGMLADRYLPLNRVFVLMNCMALLALAGFMVRRDLGGMLVTFVVFLACQQPTLVLMNAMGMRHLANPWRDFAALRIWGSVGWMIPSVLVYGWLLWRPGRSFEFTIPLCMAMGGLMVLMALRLPHTPPGAARREVCDGPTLGYWVAFRKLMGQPSFLLLLGAYLLMSTSFAIQAYYVPPRLDDLGCPREWIGPVQSIGIVWEILLFRYWGAIFRRMGRQRAVVFGCLTLAARQLLFATCDQLWILYASWLLIGTTVVLFHIGVNLLVDEIAGPEVKSTCQTTLVLCSAGLGPLIATTVASQLAPGSGENLPRLFWFATLLPLAAALLVFLSGRQSKPRGAGLSSFLPQGDSVRPS